MLRNPFYYGHFRYTGEVHEGKHQPVITKQLFDQVQVLLDKKGKPHQITIRTPRDLCGLLHCGTCHMMITGELRHKLLLNGDTHYYTYYHCTHKSKKVKCSEQAVREEDLTRQLSSLIKQSALPPDWAEYLKTRLETDKKDTAQSVSAFVQETQNKISVINSKLQRLLDGYLDQLIDQDTYKTKKNKLVSQKKSLEENLITLERTQTGWIEPMSKWIVQAENLPAIAECGTLLDKKRASEEVFGSNLKLSASEASGEPQHPWDFLAETKNSFKNSEIFANCALLERVTGIGPVSATWQAAVLPLNYTRTIYLYN